jgi:hypothetical protein
MQEKKGENENFPKIISEAFSRRAKFIVAE